jgi:hypothetical protein
VGPLRWVIIIIEVKLLQGWDGTHAAGRGDHRRAQGESERSCTTPFGMPLNNTDTPTQLHDEIRVDLVCSGIPSKIFKALPH